MSQHGSGPEKISIIICDDSMTNLLVINEILKSIEMDLRITSITDPRKVMAELNPDTMLVLLDLEMPHLSGYQVLEQIRAVYSTEQLPVIVVSGLSDLKSHIKALKGGANDFVRKPFNEYELKLRVINQLNTMKAFRLQSRLNIELDKRIELSTVELEQATEFLINKLAVIAELHAKTTDKHITRVGKFSGLLANKLGLTEQACYMIEQAAPGHDVGKIIIPIEILTKPAKLSDAEFAEMKQHVETVKALFDAHPSMMIQMAKSIAIYHHEKWGNCGDEQGCKAEAIPIEARIECLADVFNALTTQRTYKEAWSADDAVAYITAQAGIHFDPKLVELLVANLPEFVAIIDEWDDDL